VTLRLGGFAWEAIDDEAARAGATAEELIVFSVLYYLADADSGRISRSAYPRLGDDPVAAQIAEVLLGAPLSDLG
jgi:hypothetical protein